MPKIPDKLKPAERHFTRACRMSRRWCNYVRLNIRRYGDVRGNHTSGVYNENWPDRVKDRLRAIAHAITRFTDAGYAARPRYVHFSTMRSLASAVARRDGSGYYGPRP